jgi:hypothetical protein
LIQREFFFAGQRFNMGMGHTVRQAKVRLLVG